MSDTAYKIAVMQHFADGGEIEARSIDAPRVADWNSMGSPLWDWIRTDYRIKPKPREVWVHFNNSGTVNHVIHRKDRQFEDCEYTLFREVTDELQDAEV